MAEAMWRLYLDENAPTALAEALRLQGFEVVRPQEVGL